MNINEKIISAVIACYNDEQAIPEMHNRITNTFKKMFKWILLKFPMKIRGIPS